MNTEYIVLFCTVPGREVANAVADTLVGRGLAACVNIIPGLLSVYTWKGEICRDEEMLCVIKSRASLFSSIEGAIREVHPYEVPEIISLPILQGHASYLRWIEDVTKTG